MTNKPQWRVTAVLTEVRIQFKSFSASAHKEIVPHTTVGEKKKVLALGLNVGSKVGGTGGTGGKGFSPPYLVTGRFITVTFASSIKTINVLLLKWKTTVGKQQPVIWVLQVKRSFFSIKTTKPKIYIYLLEAIAWRRRYLPTTNPDVKEAACFHRTVMLNDWSSPLTSGCRTNKNTVQLCALEP